MHLKKTIIVFFAVAFAQSIASAPAQDLTKFFNNIKKGDYKLAIASVDDSRVSPSFNLLLGSLYNVLGDLEMFHEYSFRFETANGTEQDLEKEMSSLSQQYKMGNLDALIGMVFWEHGKREDAAKYLESALVMEPKNPFALNYSSMLYYATDNQKYLDLSVQAIAIKKDYSEAYVNAATANFLLGNKEEAARYLYDCLKNSSTPHPNVYSNLVVILTQTDENSDQVSPKIDPKVLDDIFEIVKSKRDQIVGFIEFFMSSSMFREAQYYLAKPMPTSSKISVDYFGSVSAFLRGNSDEFVSLSDKAIGTKLLTYKEMYDLAGKYASLDKSEKSIELYKTALKLTPKKSSILQMYINSDLGGALVSFDQIDDGIKYLLKAKDIYAKDFITLVHLGRAYKSKNMKQESLKYLTPALEYANTGEQKNYVQSLIDSLDETK